MKAWLGIIPACILNFSAYGVTPTQITQYFDGQPVIQNESEANLLAQFDNRNSQNISLWKTVEDNTSEKTFWRSFKTASQETNNWVKKIIEKVTSTGLGSNARVRQYILSYPLDNGSGIQTSSFFVEGSRFIADSSHSQSPNIFAGFTLNYMDETGQKEIIKPFLMKDYRQKRQIPHLEKYLDMLAVQLYHELDKLKNFERKPNELKNKPFLVFSTMFPLRMCKKLQKNAFGDEDAICKQVFPTEISHGLRSMLVYPSQLSIPFSPPNQSLVGTAVLNYEYSYKIYGMDEWATERFEKLKEAGVEIEIIKNVGWPEYAIQDDLLAIEGKE